MQLSTNPDNVVNEQILEIRFVPNPKILDYRGTWSEQIKVLMGIEHWNIETNRVDVFDERDIRKFFVSFRNCGSVIRNSDTKNYFPEQSIKFIKFLLDQPSFGTPDIVRFGVRTRFCVKYNLSYEELIKTFAKVFVNISNDVYNAISTNIIDLNIPINFETELGKLYTNCGPMNKEQFSSFFPYSDANYNAAIYIDLDHWKKPKEKLNRNILSDIRKFSDSNWNITQSIVNLFF